MNAAGYAARRMAMIAADEAHESMMRDLVAHGGQSLSRVRSMKMDAKDRYITRCVCIIAEKMPVPA